MRKDGIDDESEEDDFEDERNSLKSFEKNQQREDVLEHFQKHFSTQKR